MEGCVLRRIDLEGSEKVELSVFANCALCYFVESTIGSNATMQDLEFKLQNASAAPRKVGKETS